MRGRECVNGSEQGPEDCVCVCVWGGGYVLCGHRYKRSHGGESARKSLGPDRAHASIYLCTRAVLGSAHTLYEGGIPRCPWS